jgi:hypothetical protein
MYREEGEGVSDGEVDCFDAGGVLECDGTVIGELGGVEGGLGVLLVWFGEDSVSCW